MTKLNRPFLSFWAVLIITLAGCNTGGGNSENQIGDEPQQCTIDFAAPLMLGDAGPASIASEPAISFGPRGEIAVASIWVPAPLLAAQLGGQVTGPASTFAPGPILEPGGQNAVWVSTDNGVTFTARHDDLGRLTTDGHQGNQDADVVFTPDGRLHIALFGPNGIEVLSSADVGLTWTISGLLSPQGVDRQWIETDSAGNLIVAWSEFASLNGLGSPGDGVGLATSDDNGNTWESMGHIHPTAFPRGPLRSVLGQIMIPVLDDNSSLLILASDNGGETWSQYGTSLPADSEGYPGFEVLIETAEGPRLIWTEQDEIGTAAIWQRIITADEWGAPDRITSPGENGVYGWPVLRPDGSLVVFSYVSAENGDPTTGDRTWNLGYDLQCAGSSEWVHGIVAEAIHVGSICFQGLQGCLTDTNSLSGNNHLVGEIFEAGVAPNGQVWVSWAATSSDLIKSNQIWIAGEIP